MEYLAHSLSDRPESDWHSLEEHLRAVADMAASFASTFGSEEWAHLAGLWHDLGKYHDVFQLYLRGEPEHVPHAIVGALHAINCWGSKASPLAFAIAGHHTGLTNRTTAPVHLSITPLIPALDSETNKKLRADCLINVPEWLKNQALPTLPEHLMASGDETKRSAEFWIRFLFSCLVDADFLDTEEFFETGKRSGVTGDFDSISELHVRLHSHLRDLQSEATDTPVNHLRRSVLQACQNFAAESPGLFSLTVPTGGGKTLSSMAFALQHAELHALRRVIVAIPYTSIIEQNVEVYRRAFGENNVIEHHSNLDPENETRRNKLASENWDAPIIVTTNVQFFESLFSNRTSRCRKLHNIAGSVIILDEAQTFPPDFLLTILDALKELVANYGCSVVLSTATQPALNHRESLIQGLKNVREIIPDPNSLFKALRRTEVSWSGEGQTDGEPHQRAPIEWPDLARELERYDQVLTIVHKRQDARDLAQLMPHEGTFHLSALMCARHRSEKLALVKQALANGERCQLTSTQLIEAGVDIDFPVVYRALGGIDSLAQAAGRCNREGKLDKGKLVLFMATTSPPRGIPKKGLETTLSLLDESGDCPDINDPAIFEKYFRQLYVRTDLDSQRVQTERQGFNFANVAGQFELISDWTTKSIVVPFGESEARLQELRFRGPNRYTLRALQPFLVNIYPNQFQELDSSGALEQVGDTVFALLPSHRHLYSETYGLILDEPALADPAALIK